MSARIGALRGYPDVMRRCRSLLVIAAVAFGALWVGHTGPTALSTVASSSTRSSAVSASAESSLRDSIVAEPAARSTLVRAPDPRHRGTDGWAAAFGVLAATIALAALARRALHLVVHHLRHSVARHGVAARAPPLRLV